MCVVVGIYMTVLPLKTGVSTPLPVIVRDLNGEEFEWVGSAYALSATAFQPLSGGLAQVSNHLAIVLSAKQSHLSLRYLDGVQLC